MTLKVFEAFSGIGSQRKALDNLGIDHEVVAISEIDKHAIASYEAIYGKTKNVGDISKLTDEEVPECDLFTYSFPCTDISVAGRQEGLAEGSNTRSSLLWECERIIKVAKPKYLMLENVKNLVGKKHKEHFDRWLNILESYGYNNYWKVLNAKDYGIPQNRERIFVISIRKDIDNGKFKFPSPEKLDICLKDLLEKNVDEKFYLNEISQKTSKLKETVIENKKFGRLGKQTIETFNSNFENIEYGDVIQPFNYQVNKEICPTLTTRPEGLKTAIIVVTNEYNVRKLTPKECWCLMGFDASDFEKAEKVCSNSQLYKQAGNSIVVNVLEGIFKNLFETEVYK